jgi:hypothetical protein
MRALMIRHITACAVICLFGSPAIANGQCPLIPLSEALARPLTEAVFSGTVTEIVDAPNGRGYVVTFDVQRIWKGTVAKSVSLYQTNSSEAIEFRKGERFIVVAVRPYDIQLEAGQPLPPPLLHVSDCASVPLEQAERNGQLRSLGRGRPPR